MLACKMVVVMVMLVGAAMAQAPDQERDFNRKDPQKETFLGAGLKTADGGGVEVDHVVPDGPAERAGLKAGDILTTLDDMPVLNVKQVIELVQKHNPGDELKVTFVRGDAAPQTLKAKLVERGAVREGGEPPHNDMVIAPDDLAAIAQEMQRALNDPEMMDRMMRDVLGHLDQTLRALRADAERPSSITIRTADGLLVTKREQFSAVVKDAEGKDIFKGDIPVDKGGELPENVRAALKAALRVQVDVPPDVVVVNPKVTFAMPDGLTVEKTTHFVYTVKDGENILHNGPMPADAEKAKLPENVRKALDTAKNVRTLERKPHMPPEWMLPGIDLEELDMD